MVSDFNPLQFMNCMDDYKMQYLKDIF